MRGLVAVAAVVVLATTIGTAVYAMVEDDPDSAPAGARTHAALDDGAGGAVAAVCAPGFEDCEDMIVNEDGDFSQCAADGPSCDGFDDRCAAGAECLEPMPLPQVEELICPDGQTLEECFPDGVPAGYECLTLESFPVQVKCYPIECTPVEGGPVTILPIDEGPVTILPAPGEPEDVPGDEPRIDPAPSEIIESEPVPPTEACLSQDCAEDESGVVYCKPIEDPCVSDPDTGVACLPPDCVVSSDGVTECPEPAPLPCVPEEAGGIAAEPCAVPGSPGECPPDITPEECERILEGAGGGVDGSAGAEATAVASDIVEPE
jgi:hypothetical protein